MLGAVMTSKRPGLEVWQPRRLGEQIVPEDNVW